MNIINEKNLIYASSLVLFLLMFLSHFLYELTDYNKIVGMFSPTNESIFQHIKMIFFPILLYYLIIYLIFGKRLNLELSKIGLYITVTFLFTTILVSSTYYTLKYAFNVTGMVFDIGSLAVGLIISSFICIKIKNLNLDKVFFTTLSILSIFLLTTLVIVSDKVRPHVDYFYDNMNNTYEDVKK